MTKRVSFTKRQKKQIRRLIVTAILTAALMAVIHLFDLSWYFSLALTLPVYLYIGFGVLRDAVLDIGHGQIFGEKLLMAIATIGALVLGEYVEAIAVLFFFEIGELFEAIANSEARKSLSALASLCPDEATVLTDAGEVVLPVDEIAVGATLYLHVGERLVLDATVEKGEALVDFSSLTGESVPILCREGDFLPAGVLLYDAPLTLRVLRPAEESATARILELMEDALTKKSQSERFITKFSFVYTPIVVFCALIVAFLFPLFADGAYSQLLPEYVRRALNFLVVSCPCALVISIPLSFFSASGRAAKQGIVFKSNAAIERLASVKVACFDKTGTVTSGRFSLVGVEPSLGCTLFENELCEIASALESASTHPLSEAFAAIGYEKEALSEQKEVRGRGVTAIYRGERYYFGSEGYASAFAAVIPASREGASTLYLAKEGEYLAAFFLADTPKKTASRLPETLMALGIKSVILSGDEASRVSSVARSLGFSEAFGSLLPDGKVEKIELLKLGGKVAFAGDGINDAPSLAAADVSFAMGALGSDAAIEAADAVICDDDPEKVPFAIALARFTQKLVVENLVFAIGLKLLILILSAFGLASLPLAIFADVGVLVIAILNSMRALRFQRKD